MSYSSNKYLLLFPAGLRINTRKNATGNYGNGCSYLFFAPCLLSFAFLVYLTIRILYSTLV